MIKLIVGKVDDLFIIGEYDTDRQIVNNCYQLVTVYLNNTFHYSIKPLILPFCICKPVVIHAHKLSYWTEVDLSVFGNLVVEYLKIKDELESPKKEVPEIKIH